MRLRCVAQRISGTIGASDQPGCIRGRIHDRRCRPRRSHAHTDEGRPTVSLACVRRKIPREAREPGGSFRQRAP
jgi:hypothetical protein